MSDITTCNPARHTVILLGDYIWWGLQHLAVIMLISDITSRHIRKSENLKQSSQVHPRPRFLAHPSIDSNRTFARASAMHAPSFLSPFSLQIPAGSRSIRPESEKNHV